MYIIKNFEGKEFNIMNKILNDYSHVHNTTINMTACVSLPFEEVLSVQSFPLWTLPTEGSVSQRYFPAFQSIDDIELYGEELALNLFSLSMDEYGVTLQPNSGTQANQIVYNAILNHEDTVLALRSKDGGHVSHSKLGGKNVHVKYYNLDENGRIDINSIENLLKKYNPRLVIVGGSSCPKESDYKAVALLAHKYNALIMADICHTVLYIIGTVHNKIFPFVDFATFTMDKTLRGPQGGVIIYNKKYENCILQSVFPKTQGGPLQALLFSKCMCLLKCTQTDMRAYAKKVIQNARVFSDCLSNSGLKIVFNGTDSHIILIDLSTHNLTGKEIEEQLYNNRILVNRNLVPNDTKSALKTSGIRLGVVPITNLNYSQEDIEILANTVLTIIRGKSIDSSIVSSLINKYNTFNISNSEITPVKTSHFSHLS